MAATAFQLVAGLILSRIAARLAEKDQNRPKSSDDITTLSERGSPINYVKGRRRVAPVFGWRGNQGEVAVAAFNSAKTEDGWHQLAVGPISYLDSIYIDNKTWLTGAYYLDSATKKQTILTNGTPQGSLYGGFSPQDVDTILAAIPSFPQSQWPYLAHMVWDGFILGQVPLGEILEDADIWPSVNYSIGVDSFTTDWSSLLSTADLVIPANKNKLVDSQVGSVINFGPILRSSNGSTGPGLSAASGYVSLVYDADDDPDKVDILSQLPGTRVYIEISGSTSDDGIYEIKSYDFNYWNVAANQFEAQFFLEEGSFFVNPTDLQAGSSFITIFNPHEGGVNAAHTLWELLHLPSPHGLNLPTEVINQQDYVDISDLMISEEIAINILYKNEDFSTIVGNIMLDLGLYLLWDKGLGKWRILAIRNEAGLPTIPNNIIKNRPEVINDKGAIKSRKVIFSFPDASIGFKRNTITLGDDSGNNTSYQNQQEVKLFSFISRATALKAAQRRQQEVLSQEISKAKITGTKEVRMLKPGDQVRLEDDEDIDYIVESVKPNFSSEQTEVKLLQAAYAIPAQALQVSSTSLGLINGNHKINSISIPQEDVMWDIIDAPESFVGRGVQGIIPLRVRATKRIKGANLYISADNTNWTSLGLIDNNFLGGHLVDTLPAETNFHLDDTVKVKLTEAPSSRIEDLSTNPRLWRAGQQVAILVGQQGETEIAYFSKLEAIDNTTFYIQGLIRARGSTDRYTFLPNAHVYIADREDIKVLTHHLLHPDKDFYFRMQPYDPGLREFADLTTKTVRLNGYGLVPMPIDNLQARAGATYRNAFNTGDDITIKWKYRSLTDLRTGAGDQLAGTRKGLQSSLQGRAKITIYLNNGSIAREVTVEDSEYLYTNANLVSDFTSEPSSFHLEVVQERGNYLSIPRSLFIQRV